MSESESFDAFYARTVWNVTSQMHALAGEDSAADHAIREAYARAYQQWYEVAGYRDSEAWVLGVAKDAYQRRRAEAAVMREPDPPSGHDPLTWPGMFRPAQPAAQRLSDPDATVAPRSGAPDSAGSAGAGPAGPPAGGSPTATALPGHALPDVPPGGLFGSPAPGVASSGGASYGEPAADLTATPGALPARPSAPADGLTSGLPATAPAGRLAGGLRSAVLGSRRNLIAIAAAVVFLAATGIVYAMAGHKPGHVATPRGSASAVAKPTVRMLAAGRTGSRAAIPWSLIGPGWTLAEVSTAQPDANGGAAGGGRSITYLVDPEGGRYRIRTTSAGAAPDLLAWSGDARTALYAVSGGQPGGAPTYGLLRLATGSMTALALPAGVTPFGFTRPDGLNILAAQQKRANYRLERYSLAGAREATIGSLPRPAGATDALQGNALSSPDGTTAVWGVVGEQMQLVSNAGGLIRKLHVPDSGKPPSCTPISWWSSATVLAYCNAGSQPDAGRLWLVPANGSTPTPLTGVSGSPSGTGDLTGAWQAGGAVYVTSTTFAQCATAASGPGGQQIQLLGQGGAQEPVAIPNTTNHHAAVVAGVSDRLLILAQTSCPGTSSLIWFNPSTHAAQTVLTAPPTEVGVVDAVPYGSGPVAITNGLN
jgi:hypothetical protein